MTARRAPAPPPARTQSPELWNRVPFMIAAAAAVVFGVYRAVMLRWVCDDIFITLRYIQQWFGGHGIVYNAGEYVEGYTHFLWLLILAAARGIGADPVRASMWIGIAAYAATILLAALMSMRSVREGRWALPYAAMALALNFDANEWASGGLETALFTFLILSALYLAFFARLSDAVRLPLVGVNLALIVLTRPDGLLFVAWANVVIAAAVLLQRSSVRDALVAALRMNLPVVILLVPYVAWKAAYYGSVLPATFYAKSGGESYLDQGLFYLGLFAESYLTSWLFLLAVLVLAVIAWRARGNANPDAIPAAPLAAAGAALLYLGYVARVSGDFMFGRFIVPVVPLAYIVVEDALRRIVPNRMQLVVALAALAAIVFYENARRDDALFDTTIRGLKHPKWTVDSTGNDALGEDRGIVDERWYYTRPLARHNGASINTVETYTLIGEAYRVLFDSMDVAVCEPGGQNIIAYYAQFPLCINYYGLTDNYVATLPITKRGRIGHEKTAPDDYLARRGVMFKLDRLTSTTPDTVNAQFNEAWFDLPSVGMWQRAEILTYDRDRMAALHRRFHDLRNRSYIADYDTLFTAFVGELMDQLDADLVRRAYDNLSLSYFPHYPDSARQRAIVECIARKEGKR